MREKDETWTNQDSNDIIEASQKRTTDVETIPAREKLAQFKQTDAQRLALLSDDYQEALTVLALVITAQSKSELDTACNAAQRVIRRAHNGRLAK